MSIDATEADRRLVPEPAHADTPELAFEREWARAVLARSLERLRADYAARGKERVFVALQPHLAGDVGGASYAELARELGSTEGAIKVAVHRLRKSYRAALRQEVAETLADPSEVEDELRRLRAALA